MSKRQKIIKPSEPAFDQLFVPRECRLEGERLYWKGGGPPRDVTRGVLNEFVALSGSDSVLSFARAWGPLGIKFAQEEYHSGPFSRKRESVVAWKYYSRRARAVLNVVKALKSGKLGDISDWDQFAGWVYEDGRKTIGSPDFETAIQIEERFGLSYSYMPGDAERSEFVDVAHERISEEINKWLVCWKCGHPEGISDLSLVWNDRQNLWTLQVDYHDTLFAVIAFQMALAVADADALYSCSGCGLPYLRRRDQRRPKPGLSNYCETCFERGIAGRRAVESYRERQREARELHDHGTSIEEIAKRLNTTGKRVRGWIQKGRNDGQKAWQ